MSESPRKRSPSDGALNNGLARSRLWELAAEQHGYITVRQAATVGVSRRAVNQLAVRRTLQHVSYGVYRFAKYPFDQADPYMRAVLWTGVPEAALSHETALDIFEVCDVNPSQIHVTVGAQRRVRRGNGAQYVVHRQDLSLEDTTWWRETPIVTLQAAIRQCLDIATPTYLIRQAITNGHRDGRLTAAEQFALTKLVDFR